MNAPLHLGSTQSGKRLSLAQELRATHTDLIGASGRGKSYLLEYMIRQDIRNGYGLCLIDPHGTLYRKVAAWCASEPLVNWDNVYLLDASAPGFTFGFNPLAFRGANTSYAVDSMVTAVAAVWGGEDTNATPRLKRILRSVFHTLAEKHLTLLEAQYLISEIERWRPVRDSLTRDLADPIVREEWERWAAMPAHEFRERFESTMNRLDEFLKPAAIRAIVGQTDPVIDFREAMDTGKIVLVNLESREVLSDMNARTLGALLVNDIFLKGQGRPEGSRPFHLYIDECGRYVNESIQRMLDESRKRGLHVTLAHQHLAQLKQAGETVYSAVMTDAQTKIVFGGLMTEDADTMVREVFLDLDLEEPKQSLVRNVAVGQEMILLESGSRGASHTTGHAHASSTGRGSSRGTSQGTNEMEHTVILPDGTEITNAGAWGVSAGNTSGEFSSSGESESESTAETISELNGWTQSFRTLYDNVPTAVHSLDEQRYKKVAWLKKQPRQMALLVRPDFSLIPFRVATVRDPGTSRATVEGFIERRFAAVPCVRERRAVREELAAREREILRAAGIEGAAPDEGRGGDFDPWG